jgi:hypothetical protein
MEYQLYKMLPFPVIAKQKELTYIYIGFNKVLFFCDPLRQRYEKMTTNELTGCFQPNEFTYVCREEIPIYTFVPDMDCEATCFTLQHREFLKTVSTGF